MARPATPALASNAWRGTPMELRIKNSERIMMSHLETFSIRGMAVLAHLALSVYLGSSFLGVKSARKILPTTRLANRVMSRITMTRKMTLTT